MIVAFDTETTGLPDWKAPSIAPQQPHIVQLALVTASDDGAEQSATSMIVKPDGWVIPPEVSKIHGITHERAMDEGVPEVDAVVSFLVATGSAGLRVAHNISFDDRIMRIAMLRVGMSRQMIERAEGRAKFCTQTAATPILNLPPTERMLAAGFNRPKSPRLEECIQHFYGEALDGAHDALVDARGCLRVWRALHPPASREQAA